MTHERHLSKHVITHFDAAQLTKYGSTGDLRSKNPELIRMRV